MRRKTPIAQSDSERKSNRWPYSAGLCSSTTAPLPNPVFLERAWADVANAAKNAGITVILGTERVTDRGLQITACVFNPDGTVAGWQRWAALATHGIRT